MKFRPYERFSPGYDSFYLQLANELFRDLNAPDRFFRSVVPRDELIELSVVLASWFEDYANEIGLWAAFVRNNKGLYGYELPFYNLEKYDPDNINPEDIAYLLWHHCCKSSRKFIAPDSPGILEMADMATEIFDHALDKAPGTDFYDGYLAIRDNIPFFELKSKLQWMAFQNYLISPEFSRGMEEALRELFEEKQHLIEQFGDPAKLLYTIQDDYLYQKKSSFLAFNCPEWFAEVARCSEELRSDIRKLSRRVMAEFTFEGADKRFYQFRHLYIKRLFLVREESVALKGISPGEQVFTTLVEWRGEWWVTGTLAGLGNTPPPPLKVKGDFDHKQLPFYAWPDDKQDLIRETCAEMEAVHLAFFGSRLAFIKDEKDLRAALEAQNKFYNSTKTKVWSLFQRARAARQNFSISPAEIKPGRSFAIFFEPGEGTFMSPHLATIAWKLAQPELSDEQVSILFFDLFQECTPAMVHDLLEQFSARNLRFPARTTLPLLPHLEFLMRFYNPGAFSEKIPNNTIMPE